ncbi:multidrug efflux RND transporter permease subunit [Kordiimonas sediminis]|uniref:Efflux pump membrane transporter n=1 Tax=Kordiimonas sediminis TaxID=1735581 RepID=A0A919AQ07_9PROT|nr:multidrug efflux RND transporter permease subunit [Kordiimonas sediminis]GHF17879.1 multidrug efflux RND transporter permease subunit [Kordiimonas sediminis]
MRFFQNFIDRPILATVISILIIIVGGVSYFSLPVSQYPDVAPPTIQITANYPGASAEVVADTVATPIEQEINGVEGMLYMLSQATGDGRLTITVTFETGTDLDSAQVLVQNRVAIAEPRLPESVRRLGVVTRKNSPDLMMVIHLSSPDGSRDQLYISNYAKTQIVDRLARIEGVGEARIFAERSYSMRVWLDPDKIAARGLTAGEVVSALRRNNLQVASGVVNQLPVENQGAFELGVRTLGRLTAPEQFQEIVVKTDDEGRITRVGDIARVELGAQDFSNNGYLGTVPALPVAIFQRPGSNALETAASLIQTMQELSEDFPIGVEYTIAYNPTEYIAKSVDAVYATIFEAVFLVVLVIMVFLQSWRASLIPVIAIPISLIGTFAVMAAFGFSINNLTLFGLVLAVGIVVDDAIVVVENVERYLKQGMSAREAARKTLTEVGGALIAIALVLVAVFLPAAFIEGISGQFYRQFALTIATATVISAVVSLTLSPALSALLLKGHADGVSDADDGEDEAVAHSSSQSIFGRLSDRFNAGFDRLADWYGALTRRILKRLFLVGSVYVALIVATGLMFVRVPAGFIPQQDLGYFITVIQLPPGSSLSRTDEVVRRAVKLIVDHPAIDNAAAFAGFDGATFTNAPNAGAIFSPMKPFEERLKEGWTIEKVMADIQGQLFGIKEAMIFAVQPPPVAGIGSAGGWKLYVQDRNGRGSVALAQQTFAMMGAGSQNPVLQRPFTLFNTSTPQIFADIDRAKAEMLGVSSDRVFETLEVYLGSAFVNDFNFLGRTYRVTARADSEFRDEPEDIARLRTRSDTGAMVPLGSVTKFENQTAPYRVSRYNLYPAAELIGDVSAGHSTGEAIQEIETLAEKILPDGFAIEWTDLAYQEKNQGDTGVFVFVLAVVFVFLLLAALYESWLLPLAVILIVPMCILAAMIGISMRGMDNNILTQIGLLVLVGLAAKNAILIVEFARQLEQEGRSRVEAAIEAARLRLRPILMTSFAFIFGVVPLVIASGAGAEMRQALGTAVFSGMLGVTLFGLLLTPAFYVVCRSLARKEKAPDSSEAAD